ncbi:MAG: phosphatase PAP2 family protein [Spirochaetota bacterium]
MFFSNQLLFSEDVLNAIHINAGRWLDFVMVAFTQLGNELFYLLVIPFLFWCVNKRVATIVGLTFLVSSAVNDIAKFAFAHHRPDPMKLAQGIAQLNKIYCPIHSPGFPSGHAQNAVVFWGTFAYVIRHRTFTLLSIFLIIAISYSRLYLGVHFLGDVAGGIIFGTILFLLCSISLIPYYDRLWKANTLSLIIAFMVVPLVLSAVLTGNEIAKSLGVLSGFSIGFVLYTDKDNYESFRLWNALAKFLIGIIVLLILKEGIKVILPQSHISDFVRYWIMGIWISFGAPHTFLLLHLSKKNM